MLSRRRNGIPSQIRLACFHGIPVVYGILLGFIHGILAEYGILQKCGNVETLIRVLRLNQDPVKIDTNSTMSYSFNIFQHLLSFKFMLLQSIFPIE